METVAVAPLLSEPSEQISTPLVKTQAPWLGVASTKLRVAGNASVTTTELAVFGPRLVTVALKATSLPILTVSGTTVLLIPKSATDAPARRTATGSPSGTTCRSASPA